MKLKIGDLVRFVDEAIEGNITSFQGDDIIGVTDETGFEIPVSINKVTLVHGNMNRDDDEEDLTVPLGPFIEHGIYLALTGEQKEGLAKFYLINETSYELLGSISELNNSKSKGLFSGAISPKSSAQIYTANFSSIGKWPVFYIQLIRHTSEQRAIIKPISKEYRIKPVEISNPKKTNAILGEKAWMFELDKEEEDIGLDKLKGLFKS